jgi:hypothetical protein
MDNQIEKVITIMLKRIGYSGKKKFSGLIVYLMLFTVVYLLASIGVLLISFINSTPILWGFLIISTLTYIILYFPVYNRLATLTDKITESLGATGIHYSKCYWVNIARRRQAKA